MLNFEMIDWHFGTFVAVSVLLRSQRAAGKKECQQAWFCRRRLAFGLFASIHIKSRENANRSRKDFSIGVSRSVKASQ